MTVRTLLPPSRRLVVGLCGYWVMFFKLQDSAFTMLPAVDTNLAGNDYETFDAMIVLCWIGMLVRVRRAFLCFWGLQRPPQPCRATVRVWLRRFAFDAELCGALPRPQCRSWRLCGPSHKWTYSSSTGNATRVKPFTRMKTTSLTTLRLKGPASTSV